MQKPHCNRIVRDHGYNEYPFHEWNKDNNYMNRRKTHCNATLSSHERRAIENFVQGNESFCDAWERFKVLTFKFDHHGLNRWQLLKCFYEGLNADGQNEIDNACGGSHLDKDDVELEELIENLAEIERETDRRLKNIEIALGKATDLMQMLITNSHVYNVQNVPCSMCFSRNHTDGECVEDNMWTYGSLCNSWNRHENLNYNMDSQHQYHPKTYFYHHDQIQLNEENSNDSTLQDMMSRMEQLLKGMQNTSEKMDDMERGVEKLRMENLNQTTTKIDIMGGKENEFDHNQGIFSSQPMINPKNIFHEDNHASFSLEENSVISNLNEKSSFYSCEINFEDQMEHNVKGNDDLILEDIDMQCEDQRFHMNTDFSLNQEVEDYKKDIFMENVQGEFWEEDFSMDEEEEYIEKFIVDE